jgi:hypothetical protein
VFVPKWPGQVCSLGYQVGASIEGDLGITLTGEQQDRVIAYYQLDPVSGRRLVRRAAVRRPKGAGKSPEGAYCGYAELVGPVVFYGWTEDGQPVGRPHHDPWIQFAAVSEDQTDNVVVWLFDTLNDRRELCDERGIDLGRTRIYLTGRSGRMEPVTAAAGSREGQRVTYAVLDQTESWFTTNGGRKLADTLRRNTAKMGGWSLELQNAPELGDGSVADQTAKASDRRSAGVLFDTREPPNHERIDMTDPGQLRPALEFAYGESAAWVDLDRLVEEILDPDTDPNDAKRYYLNVAAPSSDWAFDRPKWGSLSDGQVSRDGDLIVAGFDGARFDDAAALVCCDVVTGHVWLEAVWERPDDAGDDYEHPEDEVTRAVEDMFDRWQVWRLYADPPYWESTVATWEAKHKGPDRKQAVVPWWTNRWRPIGGACRSLGQAIRSGDIHHVANDGDDVLTRHVRNAVRRTVNARDDEGRPLWTLNKPAPGRKIDAAMALVLAWEARRDALAAGAEKKRRGRVAAFR